MVRVVGDNVDVNIYPINKAKEMARQQGLDLVEISPNSDPPDRADHYCRRIGF